MSCLGFTLLLVPSSRYITVYCLCPCIIFCSQRVLKRRGGNAIVRRRKRDSSEDIDNKHFSLSSFSKQDVRVHTHRHNHHHHHRRLPAYVSISISMWVLQERKHHWLHVMKMRHVFDSGPWLRHILILHVSAIQMGQDIEIQQDDMRTEQMI